MNEQEAYALAVDVFEYIQATDLYNPRREVEVWEHPEGGVWTVDIVNRAVQEDWLVARFTSRAEWEAYQAQQTPEQ